MADKVLVRFEIGSLKFEVSTGAADGSQEEKVAVEQLTEIMERIGADTSRGFTSAYMLASYQYLLDLLKKETFKQDKDNRAAFFNEKAAIIEDRVPSAHTFQFKQMRQEAFAEVTGNSTFLNFSEGL